MVMTYVVMMMVLISEDGHDDSGDNGDDDCNDNSDDNSNSSNGVHVGDYEMEVIDDGDNDGD